MVPPLKAIGRHAALQPMSFPDPVHQCFSASKKRHRVMTCALTYQKNHGLDFFTDRRENIWTYDHMILMFS